MKSSISVWSGLLLILGGLPALAGDPASLERYTFTERHMGVSFRMVLYAPDPATATNAARAAFDRIAHLNSLFSDYDLGTELSRLSRSSGQGKTIPVSDEMWDIFNRARMLSELSGGAFDITIGPAVNLWRRARRAKELPEPDRLERARKAIGYEKMKFYPDTRSVELLQPNMRLDLGGIAKGFAVDEALKILRAKGIRHALVGSDGDIRVGDAPPGREAWKIQIAQFDSSETPAPAFLLLENKAVSTSGDLFQRLEIGGKRYSHIVDPRTGIGLVDHSMVTVIADESTTADALGTTLSVLGPEKGMELLKHFPSAEARMVRQPEEKVEVHESPGFSKFLE